MHLLFDPGSPCLGIISKTDWQKTKDMGKLCMQLQSPSVGEVFWTELRLPDFCVEALILMCLYLDGL